MTNGTNEQLDTTVVLSPRQQYRLRMFGDGERCECNNRGKCPKGNDCYYKKAKAALDRAHDIRQFELELLWKRTVYVGAFQTFLFAALGASFSVDNPNPESIIHFLRFIVCAVGMYSSLFWLMMNKGSKFWYQNWEVHIDFLEDEFEGKLHKTLLPKDEKSPFSVSRVNIAISRMFLTTWWILAVIFMCDFIDWFYDRFSISHADVIAAVIGWVVLLPIPFFLYYFCKLKSQFRGVVKGKCAKKYDVFMVEQGLPDQIKKWSPKCCNPQ